MRVVTKNFVLACTILLIIGLIPANQIEAEVDSNENEDGIVVDEDGMTQEVFSHDEAIVETVYVETNFDNDGDGENERISVEVIRPAETEEDLQVPVIYNMSSYNGGLNYPDYHNVMKNYMKGLRII